MMSRANRPPFSGVVRGSGPPPRAHVRGVVATDGTLGPRYGGFHFYNAAGVEIDAGILANIPLVRSLILPVGDLASGQHTAYTYSVQATLAAGSTVTSSSGGMAGKSSISTFDPVLG